ncbi:MAG TPA: glycosyltransferase family 9 protein [Natronosporangium sp.]
MILVLRALGVGDLATAAPALRGLRRAFPRDELCLAAPAWLAPLVELVGGIDRLVPVAGLGPVRWPVHGPQVAVNLHGRGPQSHRLLATAEPARLLGFACPEAGHDDGPRWRSDEHEVHRWCRLLHWYGVPADRHDLALRVPAGGPSHPGATVVHPGAKTPDRRWPTRRWSQVAAALAAGGHRVVVTGSAAERDLAGRVAAGAGLPASAVLAGRTDLADLAGLVAAARIVVSGDTGIAHLATAYGTPSVVLFGPQPPRLWGPPPERPWHRAVWRGAAGDDAGMVPGAPHPALARITVDDVLAAVADALSVAPARRRTG